VVIVHDSNVFYNLFELLIGFSSKKIEIEFYSNIIQSLNI
jgi:hypothetical protein